MLDTAGQRMQSALDHLKSDLAQIRTGRATPALVEKVMVDVYSGTQKLTIEELGQITAPDPSHLVISPWDKTIIDEISSGIAKANLGISPVVDNDLIRISIPPLTEERRKEFIKLLHQALEKYRVEIRQIRHDQLEELRNQKDDGQISEDDFIRQQKILQQEVDKYIEKIDLMGKNKEEELLQV